MFTTLDDFDFIMTMEMVQMVINLAIIIAYLCLFCVLNGYYKRYIRYRSSSITAEEKKLILKLRIAYFVLMFAMCQLVSLRMYLRVETFVDHDIRGNLIDNPVIYWSKTVMIVGFLVSLYMRIEASEHLGDKHIKIIVHREGETKHESMSRPIMTGGEKRENRESQDN